MNELMNITKSGDLTMSSREIAEVLQCRHDSVKRTIERLAGGGIFQLPPMVEVKNHLGQRVQEYQVGERDSFVVAARLSPELTAALVDYWQAHKNANTVSLPNFNDPVAAARAWAEQAEARIIAERTKAQIGSRREATAMNRASQEAKKAKKLAIQLDKTNEFSTVKRVEKAFKAKLPWQKLKKISKEKGFEIKHVNDINYGHVNAYHADAWKLAYNIDISNISPDGGLMQ